MRLALLDVIQDLGEATASECAERLDQTVANCSFHLRVLAKAGFIERAEPRGREKPWRSASTRRYLEPAPESRASVLAVTELVTATMAHISGRFTTYLSEHSQEDAPEWTDSTGLHQASSWLTADEAAQIRQAFVTVTTASATATATRPSAPRGPGSSASRPSSIPPPQTRRSKTMVTLILQARSIDIQVPLARPGTLADVVVVRIETRTRRRLDALAWARTELAHASEGTARRLASMRSARTVRARRFAAASDRFEAHRLDALSLVQGRAS